MVNLNPAGLQWKPRVLGQTGPNASLSNAMDWNGGGRRAVLIRPRLGGPSRPHVSQLSGALEPLTRGEQPGTILITGPPGSGKTCIAAYTVDQLCRETPVVDAVYVNCWQNHSPFQTLYRILDELEGAADVHRQSTATDVILERLREYDDTHCILILDEVDQLDDEDLLYLSRFPFLLIANREEDLLDGLDGRLASRLGGCERIHLDRVHRGRTRRHPR